MEAVKPIAWRFLEKMIKRLSSHVADVKQVEKAGRQRSSWVHSIDTVWKYSTIAVAIGNSHSTTSRGWWTRPNCLDQDCFVAIRQTNSVIGSVTCIVLNYFIIVKLVIINLKLFNIYVIHLE